MAQVTSFFLVILGRQRAKVYLETGTYMGHNLHKALKYKHFQQIHSIELHPHWYEINRARFFDQPRVIMHQGESSEVIRKIWEEIDLPKEVFLDAHYSGPGKAVSHVETPLIHELNAIHELGIDDDSIIIIDDIRQLGQSGVQLGDGVNYAPFHSDWSEITLGKVLCSLPPGFRYIINTAKWATNGKPDQMICFKCSFWRFAIITIIDNLLINVRRLLKFVAHSIFRRN